MEILVNATKNYKIVITNNLDEFSLYSNTVKGEKVLVICDENTENFCPDFSKYFREKAVYSYVIEAGEDSKSIENYVNILNFLAENNFKRNDAIIAFGGGVVGDLSGFCASTYMRGINFINVPTTLLSMVDSSIGGKTAINLNYGKNLVGCFYQPSLVYINLSYVKTLPNREVLSGYGEIIKYAFLDSTIELQDLKNGVSKELILKCIEIKKKVVEQDERESGIRKILNLGHTVGHAIEKLSNFQLSHGECVLKGLKFSLDISKKLNFLDEENYQKAIEILNSINYDYSCSYQKQDLLKYIKTDKKSVKDAVDFIVVDNTLQAKIVSLSFEKLSEIL